MTLSKITLALACGKRSNSRINGESMTHSVAGARTSANLSLASRVAARITIATGDHSHYANNRDIFQYPFSAVDYNPNSPYAVY